MSTSTGRFTIRLSKKESQLENKFLIVNPITEHPKTYVSPRTEMISKLIDIDNNYKNILTLFSCLSVLISISLTTSYYKLFDLVLSLICLFCFVLPRSDQYLALRAIKTFDFIQLFLQIIVYRIGMIIVIWEQDDTAGNVFRIINSFLTLILLGIAIISKDTIRINFFTYLLIMLSITVYFGYNRYILEFEKSNLLEVEVCSLYYSCTNIRNIICNLINAIIFLFFRLSVISIVYPNYCIFVKLSITFDVQKKNNKVTPVS